MNPFAHLKHAALSDVGKKRKNNEDAFGMFPEAGLFCVADGMGGGDDGEIASAAVVRAVEDMSARIKPDESGGVAAADAGKELADALSKVSAWISNRARAHKLNGCGSTFVGVIFDPVDPAHALAVHAGDSRLYLLHGHSIRQITRDHSVAELMGEKDESKVNPMFRSMVVNGIGIRDKAEPEFTPFKIAAGDRVLLCSDGLSRMVPDKRIASVARAEKSPDKAVAALIAAALDAGGIDNVTAVLVQVDELPPPLPARKPVPRPVPPEEMETNPGDDSTESGETGKTGETHTCETLVPGIAEEQPFGAETVPPSVDAATEKISRRRIPGRVFWIALAATAFFAATCAALLFMRQKPDAVKPQAKPEIQEVSAKLAPTPKVTAVAPAKFPEAPAKPVAENPLAKQAPAASPGKPEVPKSVARPEPAKPPKKTTAAEDRKKQANPDAAAAVESPKKPAVCSVDFIAACSEEKTQKFLRALQRLLPSDDRTLDFAEESERFLKSARKLARMRGSREAEAAAVDLRVLLLNAETVRSTPALRESNVAREIQAAWDEVLKGDPADEATQKSCARLMLKLEDFRR